MANNMHHVIGVFDQGTGASPILYDSLDGEWLEALQANNRAASKNETNQDVSVVGTISLSIRMRDSRVGVVFDATRSLAWVVL